MDLSQVKIYKNVFILFEILSELKINYHKTLLVYMGHNHYKGPTLASMFNCKETTLPINYLGVPLSPYAPRGIEWDRITHRIDRRLEKMAENLLSLGGRVILNSVLSAIPVYYLLIFIMSSNGVHKIEQARRKFLWMGPNGIQGSCHLANWELVCKPRYTGGLGSCQLNR